MKKLSSAILLAAMLALGLGMADCVLAASAKNADQTLDEAWTAYNIGQYNKVVQMIQPLATEGNPRAQVLLARCYENGLGVAQDMEAAAKWFRIAAEQNYAEAQVQLAYLHELGAGVPKNDTAVADLMGRAASAGNAEAQFNIALYFSQGRYGYAKNPEQSFAWAKRSADQGFAQAQRFVGACYEYGVGIGENTSEAAVWYGKAAAQGLEKEGSVFNSERVYTMP